MWQGKGVSPGLIEPVAAAYRLQAVAKPAWALSGAKEGADRGESHSRSLGTARQPW